MSCCETACNRYFDVISWTPPDTGRWEYRPIGSRGRVARASQVCRHLKPAYQACNNDTTSSDEPRREHPAWVRCGSRARPGASQGFTQSAQTHHLRSSMVAYPA
jgi:hypothetical protein